MPNNVPMWWMRGNTGVPEQQMPPRVLSEPESRPEVLPEPLPPEPKPLPPPHPSPQPVLASLSDRLKHMDGETLLLLALLWLLWQEHADRRLLLALAYIVI